MRRSKDRVLRLLSFNLLPELQHASIFSKISSDLNDQLCNRKYLKEFYERAQAAIVFFHSLDSEAQPWLNEARIRAGLNEFYSLEDAARRGYRLSKQVNSAPTLSSSLNPLLHIMYSLRHINVHVKPTSIRTEEVSVIFADKNLSYPAVILADLTKEDVLHNNEVRRFYDIEEMARALDWLLVSQKVFGISEVFCQGVEAYCGEVIDATKPF